MADPRIVIGVLGAGTMGTGIAQLAANAGHPVILADSRPDAVARARADLDRAFDRMVEKGRLATVAAREAARRIDVVTIADGLDAFRPAGIVIEAIVEELAVKRDAFARLEAAVSPDAVLATNTSSLAVAAIAGACGRPERVVGMHFFNPAPILPLVEVVPGLATAGATTAAVRELAESWGKTVVVAADTPGFIVNRIARPFYSEALRIYEEGIADRASIDWAMRDTGGFRMGPFELMDLIGNDVNLAVTRSVFEATGYDPRYRPSVTQQRLVEAGRLGRKTGRGHYEYGPEARRPEPATAPGISAAVFPRILALLINAAADALFWRIASRDDIDLAMTAGVSYPKGLLRWADDIGIPGILETIDRLHAEYGEERYLASPLLRRMARDGRPFYA